jgi:hypothetical protein
VTRTECCECVWLRLFAECFQRQSTPREAQAYATCAPVQSAVRTTETPRENTNAKRLDGRKYVKQTSIYDRDVVIHLFSKLGLLRGMKIRQIKLKTRL